MLKYICLIGLVAFVYGFPSEQQDVPSTTETVASSNDALIPNKPPKVPTSQPISIPAGRPDYAGAPVPFRIAGPSTNNNKRPIIVLHKPATPIKAKDDQESLDNAASEWFSNRWENRWWQNDNNQFDGYNPYNSFEYERGWGQPQYYFYRWY